jgi:hypothetical protein
MSFAHRGLAAVGLALVLTAAARPAADSRAEIPIRQVILKDCTPRYTIPMKVAGVEIEAMLDSGSTGLRVLPGVLPADGVTRTSRADVYSYGSGAEYTGVIATADMEVGGLEGEDIAFQAIDRFGCRANKPACPVAQVRPADYGIGGNGIPRAGFKAILGVNMADAPAINPFYGIGARRWIIDLPKPGDGRPGKLILNPTPKDLEGFSRFPIQMRFAQSQGGLHDAIWGCLTNIRTKADLCGPLLLDTGGDGVVVQTGQGQPTAPWAQYVDVEMRLGGERSMPLQLRFDNAGARYSRVRLEPGQGHPNSRIMAGPLPYYHFVAAYDADARTIGLKKR